MGGEYSTAELVTVVRWIESDTLLRTERAPRRGHAAQGRSAGLGGGVVDGGAPVLVACPAADGPARRVRRGRGPPDPRHHPGAGRPGAALHRRHDAGRCPGGTEFGLELFTGFIIRATAPGELASEELRLLIHAIP